MNACVIQSAIWIRILVLPLLVSASLSGFGQESTPAPAPPGSDSDPDEIHELTPFTVEENRSEDASYSGESIETNRVSGKLRDLAGSITLVSAQQLEDTGAVNIHDIFQYEANTEGLYQLTGYTVGPYGNVRDDTQVTPESVNRIRGIGEASTSRDFFPSNPRVPFDSYNTSGVMVSRGPDTVLFGLGNAAGLVNTTPVKADLEGNHYQVQARYGSQGDLRASFNLNQRFLGNRVAVHLAGLYSERGFERQPAHDIQNRQYVAVTAKPFQNTTIRAAFENFTRDSRRPNTITPIDLSAHWRTAGRPMWNPLNGTIHWEDGRVEQPDLDLSPTGDAPLVLPAITGNALGFNTQPTALSYRILNGKESDLGFIPSKLGTPGSHSGNMMETSTFAWDPLVDLLGRKPLYVAPGIHDPSVYDWNRINITSGNFARDEAKIYQLSLEQGITDDLWIELGYYREDFDSFNSASQTSDLISGVLLIDTNLTLMDGSPNPFAGRPLLGAQTPDYFHMPEESETIRFTAGYEFDFTKKTGWGDWLGKHTLTGFGQRHEGNYQQWRYRDTVVSDREWAPRGGIFEGPARSNVNRFYYVGNQEGIVTHDPGLHLPGDRLPEPSRDWATASIGSSWGSSMRTVDWQLIDPAGKPSDPANILRIQDPDNPSPYGSGENMGYPQGDWYDEPIEVATALHPWSRASQRRVRSLVGALQSHWWDGKLVTTLGLRMDTSQVRNSPARLSYFNEQHPDHVQPSDARYGLIDPSGMYGLTSEWTETSGTTQTVGAVVHPLSWLSVHAHWANNFTPAQFLNTDFHGNPLPTPTGSTVDLGFSVRLVENKLMARINAYRADEQYRTTGDWSGVVAGVRGVELDQAWSLVSFYQYQLEVRDNRDPGDYDIRNSFAPPNIREQLLGLTGLDESFLFPEGATADTANIESSGLEIELIYNPVQNWNIKFTAGRQEPRQSDVAPNTHAWLYEDTFAGQEGGRLQVWQNARTIPELRNHPKIGDINWWTNTWASAGPDGEAPGSPAQWNSRSEIPAALYTGIVEAPLKLATVTDGKPIPQARAWRWSVITNYVMTEGPLRGFGYGGSLRWEDRGAIGFYGAEPDADGVFRELDPDRPVWDGAHFYADLWTSYVFRLFDDRVNVKVQLNARNLLEDGGLQPIRANPDGTPSTFRIREPTSYYVTTTFGF